MQTSSKRKRATTQKGVDNPWCKCCRVSRVKEGQAKAVTPKRTADGTPVRWTITSGTLIQQNHQILGKLCDYLADRQIFKTNQLLAIELKSHVYGINDIEAQLQAGADAIAKDGREGLLFKALLIHSGAIKNAMVLRQLSKKRIFFRGKKYPIEKLSSGVDLSQV